MSDKKAINSIGELAEHLGLSRWTVSRVLNGHEGIHEKTKERVLAEIKRLNFQPNLLARSLRGGKTGMIGVCFQEMDTPILARKVSLLQSELRERGLRGIMEITAGSVDDECEIIRHFLSMKVDGIIIIGSKLPASHSLFATLKERLMPIVAMDPANRIPIPQVTLDRTLAMKWCLEHYVNKGHEKIAVLGLESDPVYGLKRYEGLRTAAIGLGLDPDRAFVSLKRDNVDTWSFEYGYELAQDFLKMDERPKAIVAMNDRVAFGAIKALREAGFSVPENFEIIGFDNQDASRWTSPALTTVSQNVEKVINAVVGIMQKAINAPELELTNPIIVEPSLVIRETA